MCGIAAAGLALSAIGTVAQISAQSQQATTQRKMYERQADIARTENALRREDRLRQMDRAMGQQRALFGASGTDLGVGTPTDVIANTAGEFARQQWMDDFNTANRIGAFDASAANSNANYGPSLFQFGGTAMDYAARRANRG